VGLLTHCFLSIIHQREQTKHHHSFPSSHSTNHASKRTPRLIADAADTSALREKALLFMHRARQQNHPPKMTEPSQKGQNEKICENFWVKKLPQKRTVGDKWQDPCCELPPHMCCCKSLTQLATVLLQLHPQQTRRVLTASQTHQRRQKGFDPCFRSRQCICNTTLSQTQLAGVHAARLSVNGIIAVCWCFQMSAMMCWCFQMSPTVLVQH